MGTTTGSTELRTYGQYGGSRPVFYTEAHANAVLIEKGVTVDPECAPVLGDKIFAGELGYFNYKTGLGKHLKTFRLAKALTASDTEVYFEGGHYSHIPQNVVLMKAPNTATGTGAAALVNGVPDVMAGKDVYKATITAGALGTGNVGDIFVEAMEVGTGKTVKIPKVNMIWGGDVDIDMPLTKTQEEWGKAVKRINGYYENTINMNVVDVPAYIAVNNKSNAEYLFKL